ncbi:MAG TPA: thioesterase family protein [Ignavibacteriaceae bacterium]|nr:thioesterase family protein [Ignavibacteriaceae bacterium]
MPEKFEFSTDISVRITDINYGNHLGNDSLLSLIHEARVRYLNNIGFSEVNIGGYGIIMVDSVIIYKSEVIYGDELIFSIAVINVSNTGCDFYYHVKKKNSSKDTAIAKTGIVFFDYNKKKITTVPKIFIEKVEKLKHH